MCRCLGLICHVGRMGGVILHVLLSARVASHFPHYFTASMFLPWIVRGKCIGGRVSISFLHLYGRIVSGLLFLRIAH